MSRRLTRLAERQESPLVESESIAPEEMTATGSPHARNSRSTGVVLDNSPARNQPIGRRKGEESGAAAIAQYAKAELQGITGLDVDHVSAVIHKPDGWHVTVDLVELRRIPAATDVLAAYEAVLGPTGTLLSYQRTRRYFRDQMLEE